MLANEIWFTVSEDSKALTGLQLSLSNPSFTSGTVGGCTKLQIGISV
jgi:hypothetical protein